MAERRRTGPRRIPRLAATMLLAGTVLAGAAESGGCADGPQPERIRAEIAAYEKEPSDERAAEIEADLAELDARAKRLQAKAARAEGESRAELTTEAERLGETRDELRSAWNEARVDRAVGAATDAAKSVGSAIGKALEDAGRKIEGVFGGDADETDADAGARAE